MIMLSSKQGILVRSKQREPLIIKVTSNDKLPHVLRKDHLYAIKSPDREIPDGFKAYVCFDESILSRLSEEDAFCLPEEMSYLTDGDVVKLIPETGEARAIFRKNSHYNHFVLTERCNSYCLMCSQPPRNIDDTYLTSEILKAIPLINRDAIEIGLTGGEPTLLGDDLFKIVNRLKNYLPTTSLHILSNGRNFSSLSMAQKLADIAHPDLMVGIPLYSDVSDIHDFVVQAKSAFDETIKGIINLKQFDIAVEIRVVIHKQTYERLPKLAEFISRNLTFVDQVVLMGLEMTGFTKSNIEALWIDPADYQDELSQAVHILDNFRIRTQIYNHQLCLLKPSLHMFNAKSISDWKNEYMPECSGCTKMQECGGFFSSAKVRYSDSIRPFQ